MGKATISKDEFCKKFPDEKTAISYLENRRWKNFITCPHCDNGNTKRMGETQYHQCNGCRKKFTVRTGTIFERSHIPLDKWLYVVYCMETSRKGVSSLQLSEEIGITQKSAWFMKHRLREVCDVSNDNLLNGVC